ncbi:ubiquitin domain-containing protein 1-like [Ornithodoros turicata]|uniref:ubiquitin domain-containing protein 1-like n=1 Tax=Ornithodoros turicata TaxID=34597 RepID=UPI003139FD12
MGGCMGTRRPGIESTETVSIGKNQPLRQEKPRWKSQVPLMEGELRSKRDEFWDTAPAFEGRKEIWDALKAAACAAEANDLTLAQAIIDGANISLPNGTLLDCYDELGNRYQLPMYCLSAPANLVADASEDSPSPESECVGQELLLKVRLSTTDVPLTVRTGESIWAAKQRLAAREGLDPARQRWFFGGKLLADRTKVQEAGLQMGFVVQVANN